MPRCLPVNVFRLILFCCSLSWLAACAPITPPRASAAPALPPSWQAPLPHGGSLADMALWWQGLDDPVLVGLVQAAQNLSPSAASALARVAQARAARTAAAASLQPSLDGSAGAARSSAQTGLAAASSLQAGVQASWELDLFGAHRSADEAAQARLQSAQAQWHDARISVAAELARHYFNQRACELQVAIVARDAASRARTSGATALSAQAGLTAPSLAALAGAAAAQASAQLTQQRAQCALEIKALVALSGVAEPALRQQLAAAPTDLSPQAALAVPSVPAQALEQRPDLVSAQRDIAAASAEFGVAQAQRYPSLALRGAIGAMALRMGGASDERSTWSIGPLSLAVPLFDGGRRAAGEQAAQARQEEAVALYQARARQAVREVEEALLNLNSAAAQSADARAADAGYRVALAAAEARYAGGFASLLELEDTRRSALAAESALVGLRRDRIQAWIALYRAVGGAW